MIPQSSKLKEEIESEEGQQTSDIPVDVASKENTGDPIEIREVECCNDFIAVLQFQIDTTIAMVDNDSTYKNEGLVVGVGPGLSDNSGGRLKPCVSVGDVVMFNNVITTVESSSPPYKDRRVAIVSERNIICKLPKKVDYKVVG